MNLNALGQGVLGCNMFAYCLNNPVNMTDESGCWSFNKMAIGNGPVTYIEGRFGEEVMPRNYAELRASQYHDFFNPPTTVVIGASVSWNLGLYSGSISLGIAFDQANYDSGIGLVLSGSLGGGSPSLLGSINGFMGVYDEPYRKNLSGTGWQYGGSVSLGSFSVSHDRCVSGSSTGIGISVGKIPVEIHGQYTYLYVW